MKKNFTKEKEKKFPSTLFLENKVEIKYHIKRKRKRKLKKNHFRVHTLNTNYYFRYL